MRRLLLLALAVALAPPVVAGESSDPRHQIERVEAALTEAVDRVSRPSALSALSAGACRGYRVPGMGAVFVLPPRTVRTEGGVLDAPHRAPSRGRRRTVDSREHEMRMIEAQVEAFGREAARSRQEAERALAELEREIRSRLRREPSASVASLPATAPEAPSPPAAPAPPAPPAPWAYWFETEGHDDPRPAGEILESVRVAVVAVLEAEGPSLTVLRPEDLLVTAVDFVSGRPFAPGARPERTLVVRARKKDLDERRAGKISAEELRRRIDSAEY